MRISKTMLFIVAGLVVIVYTSIVMYFNQLKTNRYHTEFRAVLQRLTNDNLRVNYDILSVSLYAYSNDDKIAQDDKMLTNDYKALQSLPILKNKQYSTALMPTLSRLGRAIQKKQTNITWFLILNANIKNSFVFLLNYARKSRYYFKPYNHIHQKIRHIIRNISYITRMQDSNYQYSIKLLLPLQNLNERQLNYIHTFNMHDTYIQTHLRNYFITTSKVLNSPVRKLLQNINKKFIKLSIRDDRELKIRTAFALIIAIIGAIVMLLLTYLKERDNKKLKITKASLLYQTSHDVLTGLLNRFSLENTLKQQQKYLLFLIDIDGFKHINDLYGTDIANTLLKEFAALIKKMKIKNLTTSYYRIGGDAFVVLSQPLALKQAVHTAKKWRDQIISHSFCIKNIEISVNVKIAINNVYPLLENADIGLKEIKSANEKNIMVYSQKLKLREKIQNNINILNLTKEALRNNMVHAFFQPILNLQSQKIEKYEALVRIIKKDGTIIPPISFLGVIETTPLYYDITENMINNIIKIAQDNNGYRFSLNLSMQDIHNEKLMNMLFYELKQSRTNGANIDIELLETQNLYDIKVVQAFIDKAHKFGCKILIDDFGTGYSNFAYLSQLDIDVLKIDASIVKNILTNDKMMQTIKAIVQFAKALNIQTVAEFVDNQEVLDEIEKIGIDYAQGYLIGKPSATLKTS